jgi:hypothetical protein
MNNSIRVFFSKLEKSGFNPETRPNSRRIQEKNEFCAGPTPPAGRSAKETKKGMGPTI